MKTLLLSEIFPPQTGGSGRWFYEIYRRMPRDQYLIAAGQHAQQEAFDQSHDLNVLRLPLRMRQWGLRSWSGGRSYWLAIRRLRQIVRDKRIQRIHAARCLPEGLMALALYVWQRIPYACYVHGEDVGMARYSREHTLLVSSVLRHAQTVIANSQNTANLLHCDWHLARSRIDVLHPGVDVQRFTPRSPSARLRRRLGWSERPVVLTVGRLQRRKGQDQLIRALPTIRRRVPDVLYCLVGGGEERSRLEALVDQLDLRRHVQFRGEANDREMIECYQQCDLFVLPNRGVGGDIEGFGMVLLEAQSCAKPVVAGASGGTRETMRVPESGCIVNCDDIPSLAATVLQLLRDPERRRSMGQAGRRWVEEQFSWGPLSQKAARLFDASGAALGPRQPQASRADALAPALDQAHTR